MCAKKLNHIPYILEQKISIRISNKKTNDFFDLLIETTITENKAIVNNDNDCEEKQTIKIEKNTLKYANGRYVDGKYNSIKK